MDLIIIIVIGITALVSWQGWQNPVLFNRLKFDMGAIVHRKEYDRMFTSGFLHADTMHLFFNMFALYVFAPVVLHVFSSIWFVIIYLAAILAGSLFTLLFHKNQNWYTAVGASGGVSGIVFSAIIINPEMPLRLIFLPFFDFPGWVFGLAYLGYSMFGMKNLKDNIGHAAHLGGSVIGIILTIALFPQLINQHAIYILGMLVPITIIGYMAFKKEA
ncbi:MAG: rhomboid family intramembrane serine protease [Weeksellaceae bacterium]